MIAAMKYILFAAAIAMFASACSAPAPAPIPESPATDTEIRIVDTSSWLNEQIKTAHTRNDLIAIGAVYATSDGIQAVAVTGSRRNDYEDPVQLTDAWHLGSNTKALTALLYARLVDQGKAEWSASLPDLFPDLASAMSPEWTNVTIKDLFAHNSGVGQLNGLWLIARRSDETTPSQQRTETARTTLSAPPTGTYGRFEYSNLNYIIAGAAIERILSEDSDHPVSWEEGMQALIFAALPDQRTREGWGFGPPTSGLEGHRKNLLQQLKPIGTGPTADNPVALGPAGTLHAPLEAYALFATEFLRGDSTLIPAATREILWTPYPNPNSTYAMGWGVLDHPEYGRIYTHNGSNTMWLSSIMIAPDLDLVAIVNLNQFDPNLMSVSQTILAEILKKVSADQAN